MQMDLSSIYMVQSVMVVPSAKDRREKQHREERKRDRGRKKEPQFAMLVDSEGFLFEESRFNQKA